MGNEKQTPKIDIPSDDSVSEDRTFTDALTNAIELYTRYRKISEIANIAELTQQTAELSEFQYSSPAPCGLIVWTQSETR